MVLRPLACWDCGFESHRGRGRLSWVHVCLLWVLCVVRSLSDEVITRPEESYLLWCVVVCDLETFWRRRSWPTGGCRAKKQTNMYVYINNNHRSAMISIECCCLSRKFPLCGRTLQNFRKIPMSLCSGWKSDVPRVKNMVIEGTKRKEPDCLGRATGRWSLVCACKPNLSRWCKVLLRIWHSQDRGSWNIVIIKAHKMQYFSTVFW